jgi:hypothetical protein
MVDEIDCFVLCLWNFVVEEFCNVYVGGVALTLQYPFLGCFTPWPKIITCSIRVTRFEFQDLVLINMVLILA